MSAEQSTSPAKKQKLMAELTYIAMPTNNCARVSVFLALEGHTISVKSPADYGGLKSEAWREINPQGKMYVLLPLGTFTDVLQACAAWSRELHAI